MTDRDPVGVTAAADALLAAFATHDRDAYFASFAADASFLFHSSPSLLPTRAAYELVWATWESEGFHVESCVATDRRIDVVTPDVAILTHRVRTRLTGVDDEQRERETIVFRRDGGGRWLAVHEHLSPDPVDSP
jgi:ketosteroid isomerase-like protein